MKVLVTGGTGFLGRYVVKALSCRRFPNVRVLCGAREYSESQSVVGVPILTLGDLSDFSPSDVDLTDVDVVIHCAGAAHGKARRNDNSLGEDYLKAVNVEGTLRLAEHAASTGVKRFIFVSSIGVLGNKNQEPFDNTSKPAPAEPYAQTKLLAEELLADLAESTGMELVIVRPPMMYGPGAPGNFGLLVKLLRTGLPIPLGGIRNQKSFVSVWNVADLLATATVSPDAAGGTFLVCDGEDVSTTEFLTEIATACGAPCRLFWLPKNLMLMGATILGKNAVFDRLFSSLQVDDSYTRELLGWMPPLSMRESLSRCFHLDMLD